MSQPSTQGAAHDIYKDYTTFADGIIKYIDKKLEQYRRRWGKNISTTGENLGWNYNAQMKGLIKKEKTARVPNNSEREQIKEWLTMNNDAKKLNAHNLLLIILKVKGFNTTVDGKSITTGIDNMVKLKKSLECLTGDCRSGISDALKSFCNTNIPQGSTMCQAIENNAMVRSKLDANDSNLTKWVEECCKLIGEPHTSTKVCEKKANTTIGENPNKKKCSGKGKEKAPVVIHVNEGGSADADAQKQLKNEEAYIRTLLTDYTNVSPVWRNYVLSQTREGNFVKFREARWEDVPSETKKNIKRV